MAALSGSGLANWREGLAPLRAARREAAAFAKQASLLVFDPFERVPARTAGVSDVVVLLHGLFATAGVLRPIRTAIEREVTPHTASFTYVPGPGLDTLSLRLGELVARLPSDARVHLVGHSMGGLIGRFYAQEARDPRIVQTISMASPFNGTRHARLLPAATGRDITPGSAVLERVRRASRTSAVPHLNIVGDSDRVVTERAALPVGGRVVIPECGHNGLLYHPLAIRTIVAQLLGTRRAA